nr:oligosaccharide flippase family protein [Vibrio lentus]PMI44661.1 hypothetical protein BCU43_24235 [Vibrio lentus]
MASVNKELVKSILQSVAGKYMLYIVQFATIVLLARLFEPAELGYFAIIQILISFILLMSESGVAPAIISNRKLCKKQLEGIYFFTISFGVLFSIVVLLSSYGLSYYYDNPKYILDCKYIAISVIFMAASNVPTAILLRERRFIAIAMLNLLSELSSIFFLLIYMPIVEDVSILSQKYLVFSFVRFILFYCMSTRVLGWSLRLSLETSGVKIISGFVGYQFLFNVINFFTRNADSLIIGKYFGLTTLGFYDRAYQLMRYPLQLITFAIVPAIQPSIVKINELEEKEKIHRWLVCNLLFLGVVASFSLSANASEIVEIIFGSVWGSSKEYVEVFGLMIASQVAMSSSGGFFQAEKKVKYLFITGSLSSVLNICAVVFGVWTGNPTNVAWALLISFSINFFHTYYFLYKYCFSIRVSKFFWTIAPLLISYFLCFIIREYIELISVGNVYANIISRTVFVFVLVLPFYWCTIRKWKLE